MFKRLLLCLFILLQGICFAYDKQNDEYSCGVVSAYNLINDKCPDCKNNGIPELSKLLKIDKNGTTTFNLCNGLEKYFASPSNFSIIFDATRPSLNFILVND